MSSSYNRRQRRGANPVPGPTPQPGAAVPELEEGDYTEAHVVAGIQAIVTTAEAMSTFLPGEQRVPFVWSVLVSGVASYMETVLMDDVQGHETMELMVRDMLKTQSIKRQGVAEARAAAAANPPGEHDDEAPTYVDDLLPTTLETDGRPLQSALRAEKAALRPVTGDIADPDREAANHPTEPLLGPADGNAED